MYTIVFMFEFLNSTSLLTSTCDITIFAAYEYGSYSWYDEANLTIYSSFLIVSTDNDPYNWANYISPGDEGFFCAIDSLGNDVMFSTWDCSTVTINYFYNNDYIGWDTNTKMQAERGVINGDEYDNFFLMSTVKFKVNDFPFIWNKTLQKNKYFTSWSVTEYSDDEFR